MTEQGPGAELVGAGRQALADGEWARARELFEAARDRDDAPEAWEGLGDAAWFLDDAVTSLSAREHAFRLYRERGDHLGAGRTAIALGVDHYTHSGDTAAVRGWLGRARRLLQGHEASAEYAWLRHWEGDLALLVDRDPTRARRLAAEAADRARVTGDGDLEMLAMALEGVSLVTLGEVTAGMRLLDESGAAAVGGEIRDVDTHLTTCCYLIFACERARDYGRAARWCEYVRDLAQRHDHGFSLAFCRTHYAALLLAAGQWDEAERELTASIANLELAKRPWSGTAVCLLAELRRLQGRTAEAAELLDRAEQPPLRIMAGPEGLLGRAELAFDDKAPGRAAELAERYLRRVGPDDRAARVAALELLVRAYVTTGRVAEAMAAADELGVIETRLGSQAVQGWADLARGTVAAASGELDSARQAFEDAVDHLSATNLPHGVARARLALARVLAELGRVTDARHEADLAAATFRELGAGPDATRAQDLAAALAAPLPTPASAAGLTVRELDVLGLLAVGRSNEEIAGRLVVSLRTVERHVSNIYLKIGVSGRVARAAAAAYAHRNGLVPEDRPVVG